MLRACKYCGGVHPEDYKCPKRPQNNRKSDLKIYRFRNSSVWRKTAEAVKIRDKYLCRACLAEMEDTLCKYNTAELEAHHIQPLVQAWERRTDESNIITLCRHHHELAERGDITAEELMKLLDGLQ